MQKNSLNIINNFYNKYVSRITLVILIFFLIFSVQIFFQRQQGLNVFVLGDEVEYSALVRKSGIEGFIIPSFAYSRFYKIINLCGDDYYDCSRLLNLLFFASGVTCVYLIAKRYVGPVQSLVVAFLTFYSPQNWYSAFFMPESMYFGLFWFLVLLLVSFAKSTSFKYLLFSSIVLALLLLVKIHALIIIPPLLYFVGSAYFRQMSSKRQLIKKMLFFVALIISSYLILRMLTIDTYTVTNTGAAGIYNVIPSLFLSRIQQQGLILLSSFFLVLSNHVFTLVSIFGLPVLYLIYTFWTHLSFYIGVKSQYVVTNKEEERQSFLFLISLFTFSLILVVSLFTVIVSHTDPSQALGRLHFRYYSFIFPSFYIVAMIMLNNLNSNELFSKRAKNSYLFILFSFAPAFFLWYSMNKIVIGGIDSPELRGFTAVREHLHYFLILQTLSIFLFSFIWLRKWALQIYFVFYLPFSIYFSNSVVTGDFVNLGKETNELQTIAKEARLILLQQNKTDSHITLVGNDLLTLFYVTFYLDVYNVSYLVVGKGATLSGESIDSRSQFVFDLGDVNYSFSKQKEYTISNEHLYEVR